MTTANLLQDYTKNSEVAKLLEMTVEDITREPDEYLSRVNYLVAYLKNCNHEILDLERKYAALAASRVNGYLTSARFETESIMYRDTLAHLLYHIRSLGAECAVKEPSDEDLHSRIAQFLTKMGNDLTFVLDPMNGKPNV